MKKLLIILFAFFSLTGWGQKRFVIYNSNIIPVQGKISTYDPELKSWVNFENMSVDNSLLTDLSGNGNDWSVVNSNAYRGNDVSFAAVTNNDTIWVPYNRPFSIDFYMSVNEGTTGGNIFGAATGLSSVGIYTTLIQMRTPTTNKLIYDLTATDDGEVKHWRFNIDTDSIQIINITDADSTKFLNPFGDDSTFVTRIGLLDGLMFGVNFNNEHILPFSEGYSTNIFDVVTGNRLSINNSTDTTWAKQNTYHYNLNYGYTLWNEALEYIYQPYLIAGDTIDFDIPAWDQVGNYPAGNFHNGAETGIKPPVSILPYDCNNFLFDVGNNPNVIYYENMTENVCNQIFQNVSTPYQYKDLKVYNIPVE